MCATFALNSGVYLFASFLSVYSSALSCLLPDTEIYTIYAQIHDMNKAGDMANSL